MVDVSSELFGLSTLWLGAGFYQNNTDHWPARANQVSKTEKDVATQKGIYGIFSSALAVLSAMAAVGVGSFLIALAALVAHRTYRRSREHAESTTQIRGEAATATPTPAAANEELRSMVATAAL
jgi:hypothetical protein